MHTDKGVQDPLTGLTLKGCLEVIGKLGHGFAEVIYQRALTLELRYAGIQVEREVRFPVLYKEQTSSLMAA